MLATEDGRALNLRIHTPRTVRLHRNVHITRVYALV